MIKVHCRTNLDLEMGDKCGFPDYLPAVPNVGDCIQSKMEWNTHCQETGHTYKGVHLELVVVQVTWKYCDGVFDSTLQNNPDNRANPYWWPEIELTVPPNRYPDYREHLRGTKDFGVCNMYGFYAWYGKITGKGMHAYI